MIEDKLAETYKRWAHSDVPGLRDDLGEALAYTLRSLLAGPDGPQIAQELGLILDEPPGLSHTDAPHTWAQWRSHALFRLPEPEDT